ncbi:tetratricopeptide repeat-containing glycosyltransferase family 2 protein [Clostridium lacusfryxellense]|uniref:tetratricopeptide repeat-containing glycosyltransferase family 2 protein n=1 Tax=Clostridium lacusfryxellense TaxID=205328 RepID=UPI001C0E3CF8|nr:glycosyltransferase [Clostridium lacusfryxellense]MBU3112279.1 glycosyltransferase [Clostridium lacusfryxellense]
MVTISLCMIVKNEEDVLGRCLECVKDIVDEIIIVDTGSTDNTKKIALEYTDNLFDFEWINDFSAARNNAFSKATKDYILWLDADDVILEDDIKKFVALKKTLTLDIDNVMMMYNVGFDETGAVSLSYFRERLSKRANHAIWMEPVHECLIIGGNTINTDVCITHRKEHAAVPGRNISIYKSLLSNGTPLSPRGIFYYSRELYQNGFIEDAIKYFNEFLDSKHGWVEDNISSCFDLSKCYNIVGDKENMLKILLRSFEYDTPRAEICCNIGTYYFEALDYNKAIFWYKLAADLEKPVNSWGFISHDFWGYIPNIQLSVCYDRLGNRENSIKYNNKAAEFKPNSPSVIANRIYFERG